MNAKRIGGLKIVPLLVVLVVMATAGTALAQEFITEVRIIYGRSAGIQPPEGYTKVNKDLNLRAGGDFMYLCYKKGVGAPLTSIYVKEGKGVPGTTPKWDLINIDLNRRAGGEYIYLFTTHDPMCDPITDIIVLEGRGVKAPAGYTKLGKDLNDGAGGAYIYFAYKKEPVPN